MNGKLGNRELSTDNILVFDEEDEIDENQEKISVSYAQWNRLDGGAGFVAIGKSVKTLPPGLYDFVVQQNTLIWVPVKSRTDNILNFPDSVTAEVVAEIEKFWNREEAFKTHGLPYKRGILLWGPAGSGKSSTLQLLARDVVSRGGVVIMFNSTDTFLAGYRQIREVQPEVPIVVLMEDLDAIIERQNESKILNLLDGVEDVHKVVFVATTNFLGRLGARIVNRPSRFDRRFKVAHPKAASRKMYLDTLVKKDDKVDIDRMVKDTEGMSLAHLKELFVATAILESDYDKTLTILKKMRERPGPGDDSEEDILDESGRAGYA